MSAGSTRTSRLDVATRGDDGAPPGTQRLVLTQRVEDDVSLVRVDLDGHAHTTAGVGQASSRQRPDHEPRGRPAARPWSTVSACQSAVIATAVARSARATATPQLVVLRTSAASPDGRAGRGRVLGRRKRVVCDGHDMVVGCQRAELLGHPGCPLDVVFAASPQRRGGLRPRIQVGPISGRSTSVAASAGPRCSARPCSTARGTTAHDLAGRYGDRDVAICWVRAPATRKSPSWFTTIQSTTRSPAASRSRALSTASLTASTSRSISGATSAAGDVPTREPYRHAGGTMGRVTGSSPRHHADRCPGVLRPWIADDGALVRLRLVGGALSAQALPDLAVIAGDHADGTCTSPSGPTSSCAASSTSTAACPRSSSTRSRRPGSCRRRRTSWCATSWCRR